jgi:hypothetical protein
VFDRVLFRHAVTTGPLLRPYEDTLAALCASWRGPDIVRSIQGLDQRQRGELRRAVAIAAEQIAGDWRPVPAVWLPRTAERMVVPLAGGGIVVSAVADLALGAPSSGTASVCLLEVRSSPPAPIDRRARGVMALAETLRSGAPPFRVATYHPQGGQLVTAEVTEQFLVEAVADVLSTVVPVPAAAVANRAA